MLGDRPWLSTCPSMAFLWLPWAFVALEGTVPESLTVFCLPARHRVRMQTSNMLERLNRELKRRTRVVSIFPSDDALLRLATAVLMEVDDDWMAGRKYLTMKTH